MRHNRETTLGLNSPVPSPVTSPTLIVAISVTLDQSSEDPPPNASSLRDAKQGVPPYLEQGLSRNNEVHRDLERLICEK
jgi:hypothetical protein